MSLGLSNTASTKKYYQYRSIKGMNFDGTDDNCYNDSNPGVNLFTAHTLSAWFRTSDVTADQIKGLYNDGRPRNAKSTLPGNLQFYFRMGEGDATGSGNVVNHGIVDFDLTMHSNMASGDITTNVPG